MAASPGTEMVNPASPPATSQPSHLKAYPYLFVRETDQTDYFCTVCEESLKEEELQSHLFEGHSAENLQDYFVRVCPDKQKVGGKGDKSRYLYICVVCWAKLPSVSEMRAHRNTCKVNFGDEKEGDGDEVEGVVSTPDIPTMIEEHNESNGHSGKNGLASPTSYFPHHPEVIIDTDATGGMTVHLPKFPETQEVRLGKGGEPVYSSSCLQCSLCTMVLPSSSYLSHLRAYHKISCPLNSANCPLCMTAVPIMDLTVHLASQHGLVPQSAVNALLLWVLTSNTFALNDSAQASLKAKFKGQPTPQAPPAPAPRGRPPAPSTQPSRQRAPPPPSSPARPPLPPPVIPKAETPPVGEQGLINDMRAKVPVEQVVGKFTRSHEGPGGKQSHQCLVCSKWYAVPPVKHLRSHIFAFNKEKRKALQLASGANICLICYRVFDSQQGVAGHVSTHSPDSQTPGLPGGCTSAIPPGGGLLAEALLGFPPYSMNKQEERQDNRDERDDLPLGATFETPGLKPCSPSPSLASSAEVNIELDNAGRVKSGKVRKQCELCGEWSNIKWFFKHMSEVHQALFCRCCREYLPIHEHKEHRQWHSMPPYMGQKIRIEDGQPIIIDRKERASLTPIGSLAAWGGSSGGLVVKAVDEMSRKRKLERLESPNGSVKTSGGSSGEGGGGSAGMLPPDTPVLTLTDDEAGRESLMPKERCPVCAIEITHKNLARHIKLRHGIKYKFCYKCRKLIPGQMYPEHKAMHDNGQLESLPMTNADRNLEFIENMTGTEDHDEDDAIEIPEEMLDEALDGVNSSRRKDDQFRANTSMNKLESLMGKEFKHPRRQCKICGYSVSYSNFKRHLRNAHPGEADDSPMEGVEMLMEMEMREGMVGNPMDDQQELHREDGSVELKEGYAECNKCGDVVLAEQLGQHTQQIHGNEGINKDSTISITPLSKGSSPRPRNIIMRACPVCSVEMRSDSIPKHCKMKHKVSYRYCSSCSKYVLKKYYKSHVRKHDTGDAVEQVEEEGELDTSKDGEDEEEDEEGMDTSDPAVKGPSKIYNCVDCTRMFMSAEAHANHLREVHGGEGGSVVLKLPGNLDEDEDVPEDQLVIDDS